MAVIGEIQKRPWLLLVVIFVGMLAFILGDAINSSGGGVRQDSNIATVNGKNLTSAEYARLVDIEFEKTDSLYKLATGRPAPSSERQRLNETFITRYLMDEMLQTEYNKVGLKITDQQFNDLIQGKNVDGSIYKQFGLFVGPDKEFSQDSLNKNIRKFLENGRNDFLLNEIIGEQAMKNKLQKKYINMISKGLYINSYEAKKSFENNSTVVNLDYVYRSYASVPEADIEITEADLKAYYTKHKSEKKYEQKDKFSFEYAEFPITPSADDLDFAREYLENRKELFKEATSDTNFVVRNSDNQNLDFSQVAKFPKEIDSIVQVSNNGDVIGPYLDGEFYKISKVISNDFEDEAEVRHILLSDQKHTDKNAQKSLADSLVKVIKADKSKFESLVLAFSNDQGSLTLGGNYGYFGKGKMVKEFEEVSFNKAKGSVSHTRTEFGIHIIEVLNRRNTKKLKVATVDFEISRSNETISAVRDLAVEFTDKFTNQVVSDSVFNAKAKENNIVVFPSQEISLAQKTVPGIESGFENIKRWAFENSTKEGRISDDFVFDKKVVIAHLISKSKEGTPVFADLSKNALASIQAEVLKEKQAAALKALMTGSTLEEVAKSAESTVQKAENVTLANPNLASANEPKVIGTALGMKENSISKAIEGVSGVYIIAMKSIDKQELPTDLTQNKQAELNQLRGNVENRVVGALKEKSNLEDNREKVNILDNN